jgi:cytochrome c oxidase assembly protein subunit 15
MSTYISASSIFNKRPAYKTVAIWLFFIAFLITCMIVVGGLTRLTGSGLSITEWKPIHGAIPPLSLEEWREEFNAYKQIPQYIEINKGMTLEEFKNIFWWEWGHRQLGRFIGIAFFIPLLFFWIRGRLADKWKFPLLMLLLLGGMQGAVGWFMVQSGLTERTSVSQYRLAFHLSIAFILLGFIIWYALKIWQARDIKLKINKIIGIFLLLVFVQIVSGAFVAGLHAGTIFNTFPLIKDTIFPEGLFPVGFKSLFEDHLTVQFFHRMLAYLVLIYGISMSFCMFVQGRIVEATLLTIVIITQISLGIATLITVAPLNHIWLASIHQMGAVLLFITTVCILFKMSMKKF